jgi:hypothetical protein
VLAAKFGNPDTWAIHQGSGLHQSAILPLIVFSSTAIHLPLLYTQLMYVSRNRTRDLMISSQVLWPLDHEASFLRSVVDINEYFEQQCDIWVVPVHSYTSTEHFNPTVFRRHPYISTEPRTQPFFFKYRLMCVWWNQLHALFIFSLFSHYTSTCFGLASCPSPGGNNV